MLDLKFIDRSTWRIVSTGDITLKPGDIWEDSRGEKHRVLQYPTGSYWEPFPGLKLNMGPEYDPEIYIPRDGEVLVQPMIVEEDGERILKMEGNS